MRLPLLPLALVLFAAAPAAYAGDPPTPAQTLVAELDAAKAAKEDGKWIEAAKRVATLYPDANEADKKALAAATGGGLKSKSDTVQTAALDALVATKDGDAAWKAGLKSELPDEKAETAKPFSMRVLEALKDLHPDGAIAPVMNLLQKAKDPKVCAKALLALGGYERSKQRVTILEELIKTVKGAMPSRSTTKASSPTPRWTEMEPNVIPALNALTGQTVADLGSWLKFWDDNSKKPAAIFKNPL